MNNRLSGILIVFIVCNFVFMPLYVQSQHFIGVTLRSGFGKLGNKYIMDSDSYGYFMNTNSWNGTQNISIYYTYQPIKFLTLTTEINLSRYVGSEDYSLESWDPHSPGFEYRYDYLFSYFTFGIPLYINLKIKKTNIFGGYGIKSSIVGTFLNSGHSEHFDYYEGMIVEDWNYSLKIKPSNIIMTGYTFGIIQEISDKLSIELLFSKYKIKNSLSEEFSLEKSFEIDLGIKYNFYISKPC
ncbi:MAG: hypothetical protein PHH30_00535 [Bacteroidales bacterium]|nr:hypothetical protein [Bacteroidales bacterium]MDD3860663.1 hypothetical protein [Bacteroidales bacterium]